MALDFLNSIGNLANTVNQAAGPLNQILSIFRKDKGPSAPNLRDQIQNMATNFPQSQAERQALQLLSSLANPNDPRIVDLRDEEFQNLRSGVQSDIRSKVLADRRERSMGRAPVFFDPERADENIAFQISRGTPMLKQQAQQNAIQRILEAAGVGKFAANADSRNQGNLNAMASLYALDTLKPPTGGSNQMGSQAPGLFGKAQTGLDGLQQILKIFQQGKEQYGPPQPENIRWNQMRYNA